MWICIPKTPKEEAGPKPRNQSMRRFNERENVKRLLVLYAFLALLYSIGFSARLKRDQLYYRHFRPGAECFWLLDCVLLLVFTYCIATTMTFHIPCAGMQAGRPGQAVNAVESEIIWRQLSFRLHPQYLDAYIAVPESCWLLTWAYIPTYHVYKHMSND